MSALRFRVAWAQIRHAPGRFAAMAVAIAVAVALSASVLQVSRRLVPLVDSSVEAVIGRADLRVVAISPAGLDEKLVPTIAEQPGVAVVAPVIHVPTFLDGDATQPVSVWGLDFLNDGALEAYDLDPGSEVELGDPLVFLSQPDSVIAPRDWLAERGLHAGDRLSLATPAGLRPLVVRGVLGAQRSARLGGAPLLLMDVYAAQTTFGYEERFSHVDVVVAPGADVDDVARRLATVVDGIARVESGAKRQSALRQVLAGLHALFFAFSLSGLLLSVIVTFSRASAIFHARRWELGVSRALGATPAVVQREMLKEVGLVALCGAVVGLPLGSWLATFVAPRITLAAASVAGMNLPPFDVPTDPGSLVIAAALGIGGTLAGALVPARRAARMPIAQTLAARGVDTPVTPARVSVRSLVPLLAAAPILVWLEHETRTSTAGFGAMLVVIVAACLLVPLVLKACLPLLTPLVAASCGAVGRLAMLAVERSPQRTTAIVRLFAAGLAVVIWLSTIVTSLERELPRVVATTRHADLMVGSAFDLGGEMQPLGEDLVTLFGELPGIERVSVERALYGSSFGVSAFDAAHFSEPRFARWDFVGRSLPDALERVARGEALLVTPGFAARRGVSAGDQVTLDTPAGPLRVPIAGIASVSTYSASGDIVLELGLYRRYWRDATVSRIHLLTAPGTDLETMRREVLRAAGPTRPIRVLTAAELGDYYAEQVRRPGALLRGASLLVLLLVALGISDALLIEVLERTRELGTMRALGTPPRSIYGMIVLETLVLAAVSAGIALVLGFALSWILLRATMPSLIGWAQAVHFDAHAVAATIAVALAAALVGALAPAWRASRIAPAVALRTE